MQTSPAFLAIVTPLLLQHVNDRCTLNLQMPVAEDVTLHEDTHTHTQTELERHIRVRLFNNRLSLPLTAALLQQCTLGKKTKKYISISKTNRLIPDDFNSALPQWHKLSKAAIQLIAAAQTKTNRPGERRRNLSEEAENDPRSA